jgi:hypothetical protein
MERPAPFRFIVATAAELLINEAGENAEAH